MDFRMSNKRSGKSQTHADLSIIEVKSKFEAEFRRFPIKRDEVLTYDQLVDLVLQIHRLYGIGFSIWYKDPIHGDLLPINNNENCLHALNTAQPILRLILQRVDGAITLANGNQDTKRKSFFGNFSTVSAVSQHKTRLAISTPQDFRRVSAIIDVDILPETVRRVRLCKHNTDKPLGFYIRDGTSVRVTPDGIEKVLGIFISRLIPGGLAESTGLLSVNDEVLEVNGIEVSGKGLDQVTDMMVANSHNLIITVKPVNQLNQTHKAGSTNQSDSNSRRVTTSKPHTRTVVAVGNEIKSGLIENSEPLPDSDDEDTVSPIATDGIVHV